MRTTTRSREYREGWTGRRRTYECRACGEKFQHDGGQLPLKACICPSCRTDPENLAIFQISVLERKIELLKRKVIELEIALKEAR